MKLSEFARERIKTAGVSAIAKTLFKKGLTWGERLARAKKRTKLWLGRSTIGTRGMVGKGVGEAGKGMLTSPIKTMKRGFKEMRGDEKAFAGGLGVLSAQDAVGKLEPGETRAGRVGSNLGMMAGLLATPYKKVGILGNILASDIIGGGLGRQAGRLTSKITGIGGAAKPGSMEYKFRS